MKNQSKLRDRYIQLVETFITALESGRTGSELEDIRNEIRAVSSQLGVAASVEKSTQAPLSYPAGEQDEPLNNPVS
ncbi:MAG TPA: hypothetical protein VF145_05120 [Chitinophagaceae bacterium]